LFTVIYEARESMSTNFANTTLLLLGKVASLLMILL
jgi:hypothetical protein